MGLGLMHYLPQVLYAVLLLGGLLSVFVKPMYGALVLFPILPYLSELEKLQHFPMGKNIVNVLLAMIVLGWFIHREQSAEKLPLALPVSVLMITSCVAFLNGIHTKGFTLEYLVDWKDYMVLPLVWFFTVQAFKDKKTLKYFTLALVLGVVGVAYFYVSSLKWMNLEHFSYRVRDSFYGLFLYLGPNHYGAFFTHMLFVLTGLFLFLKSKWSKLGLALILGMLIYCIMYSFSRGAYLALIGGFIVMALVKERILLVLGIVFLLFWKSLVPVSVVERVTMTKTADGQLEESAADRVMLWQRAFDMFKESPLIGKGYNTFEFAGYKDTHNYYLKMLAEQGLMGLAAFLYLLIAAMILAWKLYRRSEDDFLKGIGFGFALSVFSLMITNVFGDRWSYLSMGSYFWAFMGVMTRSYLINKEEMALQENSDPELSSEAAEVSEGA